VAIIDGVGVGVDLLSDSDGSGATCVGVVEGVVDGVKVGVLDGVLIGVGSLVVWVDVEIVVEMGVGAPVVQTVLSETVVTGVNLVVGAGAGLELVVGVGVGLMLVVGVGVGD
jgi:hypothetical protein